MLRWSLHIGAMVSSRQQVGAWAWCGKCTSKCCGMSIGWTCKQGASGFGVCTEEINIRTGCVPLQPSDEPSGGLSWMDSAVAFPLLGFWLHSRGETGRAEDLPPSLPGDEPWVSSVSAKSHCFCQGSLFHKTLLLGPVDRSLLLGLTHNGSAIMLPCCSPRPQPRPL